MIPNKELPLLLSPIVLMAGAAVNGMQLQNNTVNTDSGFTSLSVLLLSFGCRVPPLLLTPPSLFSSAPSLHHHHHHHHPADPALCSGIIRALISNASGIVSGLWPQRFRMLAGSNSKSRKPLGTDVTDSSSDKQGERETEREIAAIGEGIKNG